MSIHQTNVYHEVHEHIANMIANAAFTYMQCQVCCKRTADAEFRRLPSLMLVRNAYVRLFEQSNGTFIL